MGKMDNDSRFAIWLERSASSEQFREIVQEFSSSFNFKISFYSKQGSLLRKALNYSPLCFEVRNGYLPKKRCLESIENGVIRSINSNKILVFRCFCGAGYLAVPMMIDQSSVGCIVCGPFLFKKYCEDELAWFLKKLVPDSKGFKRISANFMAIPVVGVELIERIRSRLVNMASYTTKMFQREVLEARGFYVSEQEREDTRFEESLKILQDKDLRSQLSLHFLFNTLNALSQLAMLEGAVQTQELTYKLSEYLRYVLRKQMRQELVPLSFEMDNIKRYLEIYKVRFRERLSYEIQIGQGADKAKIPFMLLQPIIENALLHGIEPSIGPGKISIRARVIETSVMIEIKDNGVGCDSEKLNQGIGLQNVRDRMSLHFGLLSDLLIISKLGDGTSVSVRIPFEGV
ncbi:MAG: histidine kinase [Thermovirga sp.]|nr:histidine kinase [Thermovirga sp.]